MIATLVIEQIETLLYLKNVEHGGSVGLEI